MQLSTTPDDKFYQFGTFIYRFRWVVISLWIGLAICCIPFLPNITAPFKTTGFIDETSASAKANDFLNEKLGYQYNRMMVLYSSKNLIATNPLFNARIEESLSGLQDFPLEHEVILPKGHPAQISKDKHTAYAAILFKNKIEINNGLLGDLKSAITIPPKMNVEFGGEPFFIEGVNQQTQIDLYKADLIATPVSIITMLIVFGSVLAALLPIMLGGCCAVIILTVLYAIGQAYTLSIFTINIAMLLGICLSLDYALFIISRFRSELRKQRNVADAIAITQSTAGKAVFFSGLAVFVSLSALLLFPINILISVGVGGSVAVFVSVMAAIVLLPAILGVLNNGINMFPILFFRKTHVEKVNIWTRFFNAIVHYPMIFFISILIFLLLLGYPFLHAKFGVSDYHILPKHSQTREFFNVYGQNFNEKQLTPIQLVVTTEGNMLSQANISKLYDLGKKLERNKNVGEVTSIVNTDPQLTKAQYFTLYNASKKAMSSDIKQLLKTTTTPSLTVMTILPKYDRSSAETQTLIRYLREVNPGKGLKTQLTGTPVSDAELLHNIYRIFPYAVLWIMGFTYLILMVLLRSVFLPLKAILMNVLSLCASYGILVFIIQEGHLHTLLNFEPQGMLDISLLVIIFCAVFGFSMDYEVFLLTRIKEFYDSTGDNEKSIVYGLKQSSRIITSAAIIVILTCASFMVADVLMVKAFGLGIAIAIFVDAFLIRTILVPATMSLLKQWNWYLPKWLDKILP